jgi:hypothetical protein
MAQQTGSDQTKDETPVELETAIRSTRSVRVVSDLQVPGPLAACLLPNGLVGTFGPSSGSCLSVCTISWQISWA